MPRRALELGEAGNLEVAPYKKVDDRWVKAGSARDATVWRASCYVRDQDGVRRRIIRRGKTKVEARKRAEQEIERIATGGVLSASAPFLDYGEAWLLRTSQEATEGQRRSIDAYRYAWRKIQASNLRGLTIEQANHPQRIRVCLQSVADSAGPGAMKSTRSVLSNILQAAIADGILTSNAVRQVAEIKTKTSGRTRKFNHDRACTLEEREHLFSVAYGRIPTEGNPRTIRKARAAADILSICFGIATRIDEARHLRWEDVDLEANAFLVHGTKSETSDRLVSAPQWLLERLAERALRTGRQGYVVASPNLVAPTSVWSRSNSAGVLREVLDEAGLTWAVPHTGRRTVASLLEKQGVPGSDIADFLGHNDLSTTIREYIGRDMGGPKHHLSSLL